MESTACCRRDYDDEDAASQIFHDHDVDFTRGMMPRITSLRRALYETGNVVVSSRSTIWCFEGTGEMMSSSRPLDSTACGEWCR